MHHVWNNPKHLNNIGSFFIVRVDIRAVITSATQTMFIWDVVIDRCFIHTLCFPPHAHVYDVFAGWLFEKDFQIYGSKKENSTRAWHIKGIAYMCNLNCILPTCWSAFCPLCVFHSFECLTFNVGSFLFEMFTRFMQISVLSGCVFRFRITKGSRNYGW